MENIYIKNDLTSQELHILSTEMDKNKKSTAATWLLWLFFGGIGGHRYYLGKYGTAVLMTITLGCFGIWTLIDLFLINGMLKRKNEQDEAAIISQIQQIKNAKN